MRVVVIGAGLSGLIAARQLVGAGSEVVLLDKGRSPGGRLATRRIGNATFDHGAQFFTVRTPAFARQVAEWQSRDLVRVWNHGFEINDGHPRYIAIHGMNSLAKDLAAGLDVRCSTMAFAVKPGELDTGSRWRVVIDDGTEHAADAVVVTSPLAQAFALLVDTGIELDEDLFRIEYHRTIGLLAHTDTPVAIGTTGGLQPVDEVFGFIGDNLAKGVSNEPAITFHATPAWSLDHWDDDPDTLVKALTLAAQPWLGSAVVLETQLKKWRFAMPQTPWPEPCWSTADNSIVVAGDAFAGPRVEGAHNSGLAAAHVLTR